MVVEVSPFFFRIHKKDQTGFYGIFQAPDRGKKIFPSLILEDIERLHCFLFGRCVKDGS